MVNKLKLSVLFLFFTIFHGDVNSELKNEDIIREIYNIFSSDIGVSKEISSRREYYLSNINEFENGPVRIFLEHADPEITLLNIIGQVNYNNIPIDLRAEIVSALENTFRRYAYEWLHSKLNTELKFFDVKVISNNKSVILVDRNIKILPDMKLKLYVSRSGSTWKVFDFGFWDFTYTRMKRRLYLSFIKNNDYEGLLNYLKNKNYKFFKKL